LVLHALLGCKASRRKDHPEIYKGHFQLKILQIPNSSSFQKENSNSWLCSFYIVTNEKKKKKEALTAIEIETFYCNF
jgi:hypothetical protein